MLHPLLESDICECIHKGKVIFSSSHQNFLLVTEAGILTPSDLSKAKIIGCTNPTIKGGPCSKLVKIPKSITTNLLEVENEKVVLAECISQVLTDKGSPIILQGEPKAKGILEIEQDSIQDSTQDFQDSNSSYPYHSSYPHLASKDKNIGVKEIGEEMGEKSKGLMVLEIVRKWEYSPNNEDFEYWATISEFNLKLNNEIVKDSNNQEIKGYIIEPAGANPNIDKSANEQQKTAGSDTRIPAGEYEVFWRKSSKRTYLKETFDFYSTLRQLEANMQKNFLCTCKQSLSKSYPFHTHIMPYLKSSSMGNRTSILIHNGAGGGDSEGCLLPSKNLRNQLLYSKRQIGEKYIDIISITQDTNEFVHILMNTLLMYDIEAFINYNKNQIIKNFIIKIEESKIQVFNTDKEMNEFLQQKNKGGVDEIFNSYVACMDSI